MTFYMIICIYCVSHLERHVPSIAVWFLPQRVEPVSSLPGALTHQRGERWGDVNFSGGDGETTTQEAGGEGSIVTADISHIFIISPCHIANSNLLLSLRLPLSLPCSHFESHWWTWSKQVDLSVCALCPAVSGETAWCSTLPGCHGWATSGWWRLFRWRLSVESRTSTAASLCPQEARLSPTLESSLSEVSKSYNCTIHLRDKVAVFHFGSSFWGGGKKTPNPNPSHLI